MSTASLLAARTTRHKSRHAAWCGLIALVMALQSLAMGVLGARGVTHRHATADTALQLTDFRRQVHLAASHLSAERHHHGLHDASLRRTAEDRLADVGADGNDHGGLQLPLALLGESTTESDTARIDPPLMPTPAWVATWHDPSHPDRPPQPRHAFAST